MRPLKSTVVAEQVDMDSKSVLDLEYICNDQLVASKIDYVSLKEARFLNRILRHTKEVHLFGAHKSY